MDTISDILSDAPQNADPVVKRVLREEYAEGKMKIYFTFVVEKLTARGGPYFAGENMSVSDIALYGTLKTVRGGTLDYIPVDYDTQWPQLQQFIEDMESNPVFAPYKL